MSFFSKSGGALPARPGEPQHRSQHCVLFAVDIVGFTDRRRDDEVQLYVRHALYTLVSRAFDDSLLGWADCLHEDRGDGILVVIPQRMPAATVVDPLLDLLRAGLRQHNSLHNAAASIRLRVAIHVGEVHRDDHGLVSTAVNHLFRLLEAPAVKEAAVTTSGDLVVIVSDYFYEAVVRHGHGMIDPLAYSPVLIEIRETKARGWLLQSQGHSAVIRNDIIIQGGGTVSADATDQDRTA